MGWSLVSVLQIYLVVCYPSDLLSKWILIINFQETLYFRLWVWFVTAWDTKKSSCETRTRNGPKGEGGDSSKFKTGVTLAAIKRDETRNQIASSFGFFHRGFRFRVHPARWGLGKSRCLAVLHWSSKDRERKKVLCWIQYGTLALEFFISCLERARALNARPEISGLCQGCQYTGGGIIEILETNTIHIDSNGRGSCLDLDNIFIERFYRSMKYELIHLREFAPVPDPRHALTTWFSNYD